MSIRAILNVGLRQYLHGMDACFSILRDVVTFPEAMERDCAERDMTGTAEPVFRLIQTLRNV